MDSLTSYQYITCIDQLARTLFFSPAALRAARHLINVTLGLRGFGRVVQERRHGRGLFAAAARAATPEASLARAPARNHAHRRGLLYLRRASPGFPTGRPCVPARIACSADAWRNQNLRSSSGISRTLSGEKIPAVGRCGATERQASLRLHTDKVQLRPPRRPCLSLPPPMRAQMSDARRECGRAELALRRRCFGCRSGGAVPRAKGLFWRLVP